MVILFPRGAEVRMLAVLEAMVGVFLQRRRDRAVCRALRIQSGGADFRQEVESRPVHSSAAFSAL